MMSKTVQDNLIRMVRSYAQSVKKLDITWYGGEPLLALDIIESLTSEFLKICDEFGLEYSASIITNGYLLTPDVAKRLNHCRIHCCQITLDGDRNTHNMQRPRKDGSGTFDVIIQNLKASSPLLASIALRVNVSRDCPKAYTTVKKLVAEEGIVHTSVYSSPILDSNGCYPNGNIFTNESFYEEEYKELAESPDRQSILQKYPMLRFNACGADYVNSFVINFNGDLYKCWSDIGCEELCFGNIGNNFRKTDLEILYIKDDPTYDNQCNACKFLPICIGGCPYKRRTNDPNRCIYFQNIFENYIRDIEKVYRSGRQKSHV